MNLEIENQEMSKWDKRFCLLSEHVSHWSKDPRAKVGAVIVVKKNGAIALGYNGFPMGVEDTAARLEDNKIKQDMVVHAEQNALLIAGGKAKNATIYVWGKPICSRCAGMIIQSGIKRVVAINPDSIDESSKWFLPGKRAIEMFTEANVKVNYYRVTEDNPIASVEVYLDEDIPEYMPGTIRCGSVISSDKKGNQLKDHQDLIDNKEFDTKENLVKYIADKLNVDKSIISIVD